MPIGDMLGGERVLRPIGVVRLILRAFLIYFRELRTLLLFAVIAFAPYLILSTMEEIGQVLGLIFVPIGLALYCVPATIVVSLAERHRKATVLQVLRRLRGGTVLKVFLTGAAQYVVTVVISVFLFFISVVFRVAVRLPQGCDWVLDVLMVALTVTAILALASRFLFAGLLVILEQRWLLQAFRRSAQLSRGHRIRISTVVLAQMLLAFPVTLVGTAMGHKSVSAYVTVLGVYPVLLIVPVLLYYDIRARKEAFGTSPVVDLT